MVDATDSIRAKAAMIAHCKRNKIPIVTVGGAGGQIDPTQVTKGDLAKTTQDPLAAKLRSELRRNYNFSKTRSDVSVLNVSILLSNCVTLSQTALFVTINQLWKAEQG